MADSIINFDDPSHADIVLIGVDYDRTSSFGKGADKGPEAIVNCLHTQIELWDRLSDTVPAETARIAYTSAGGTNHLAPEEMLDCGEQLYSRFPNAFKFMLGGEHSVRQTSRSIISPLRRSQSPLFSSTRTQTCDRTTVITMITPGENSRIVRSCDVP